MVQLYANEKSIYIKNEIINQLINDSNAASIALIRKAIAAGDIRIQKNIVEVTKTIPDVLLPDYESLLNGNSYDMIVTLMDKLSAQHPEKTADYLARTKDIEGCTGINVRIKWLELSASADKKYFDDLVKYTGQSYEFRTRVNAMYALKRQNYFNKNLLENITQALQSANGRLAGPAGECLQYYYAQSGNKKVVDDFMKTFQADEATRSKINSYLK